MIRSFIAVIIAFVGSIIVITLLRKIAVWPTKRLSPKTTYKIFAGYLILLLLSIPTYYVLKQERVYDGNEELRQDFVRVDKSFLNNRLEELDPLRKESGSFDYDQEDLMIVKTNQSEYTPVYVRRVPEATQVEWMYIYPRVQVSFGERSRVIDPDQIPKTDVTFYDDQLVLSTMYDTTIRYESLSGPIIGSNVREGLDEERDEPIFVRGNGASVAHASLLLTVPEDLLISGVMIENEVTVR
ncbi:hypothetical protein FLK61_33645 [Paenalkalicoccus suaedae]|uniref:Uncharacterized protein n=1 Tax=Paenalkalicoccus suaedae TaxID=2592382 RepID=A0A859FG27_9BACI|nr:hypothetical protein [Paenalkalicoccus suaedae]QKS71632.1 hypothetical protein FLK61_33645 [Paenalkalicoccus suaedae]